MSKIIKGIHNKKINFYSVNYLKITIYRFLNIQLVVTKLSVLNNILTTFLTFLDGKFLKYFFGYKLQVVIRRK